MLDRSAVNGSLLPLGEEPLGEERLDGGRLAAFTGLSTLCFERLFASAFSLPLALPLANFSTTAFLASPLTASQVVAPFVIVLPAISAVQPPIHQSFHTVFQERPGKPRFFPAWRIALFEALCLAYLPFQPRMN